MRNKRTRKVVLREIFIARAMNDLDRVKCLSAELTRIQVPCPICKNYMLDGYSEYVVKQLTCVDCIVDYKLNIDTKECTNERNTIKIDAAV